jgi:hypothetical protein
MGAVFSSEDEEHIMPYVGGGPDGEVITPFTCCCSRRSGTRMEPITTWEQEPDDFIYFNDPILGDYNAATIDGRTSPLHWA